MDWGKLFGVGGGSQGLPPPGDQAGMAGGQEPPENAQHKGEKSVYTFDSTALERAAQAAKSLENNKYARDALELTREQEKTAQLQMQKAMKEMEYGIEHGKIEQIKAQQEEQRKTLGAQAKIKKEQSEYEDQLSRRRYQDQLGQQARLHEENLKKQEDSIAKQEAMKRASIEHKEKMRHENDMKRLQAELSGRAKIDRENHDLKLEELRLKWTEQRATWLEGLKTMTSVVGGGLKNFMSDPAKIGTGALTLTLFATGLYSAKYGTGVLMRFAESRLGKPSLIRETNRRTIAEVMKHPVKFARSFRSKEDDVLSGIVLKPQLEERLREIAIATRHTKKNKGFYRNVLFYGAPGTGKSMFARALAQHSDMHYAIMTGGDVAPMGKDGVTAIHKVFNWAQTSQKGVLLFVDEADAFLRKRSQEVISEDVRATLNAFLYHTGEHSKKFMLVLASNQPEQFDWAINDRLDEFVEFTKPNLTERERMVRHYFDKYILQAAADQNSRLKVADFDYSAKCSDIAAKTEGFSGREIAKLAISWQASGYAAVDGFVTEDVMDLRLQDMAATHSHKVLWRDYRVGDAIPNLSPEVATNIVGKVSARMNTPQ